MKHCFACGESLLLEKKSLVGTFRERQTLGEGDAALTRKAENELRTARLPTRTQWPNSIPSYRRTRCGERTRHAH